MFGGLHIMELAALKTTENLVERSCWTGELVRQVLQHVGKQTRFRKHHTSPQHDEPTR